MYTIVCMYVCTHTTTGKQDQQYFVDNFNKFKLTAVILGINIANTLQNYQYNKYPRRLINSATLPCKMKCSPYYYTTYQNEPNARKQTGI